MEYICPQCGRTGAPRKDSRGAQRCTFCWERVVDFATGSALAAMAPEPDSESAPGISVEMLAHEEETTPVIFVEMPELIDDEAAEQASTPMAHPKPKKKGKS